MLLSSILNIGWPSLSLYVDCVRVRCKRSHCLTNVRYCVRTYPVGRMKNGDVKFNEDHVVEPLLNQNPELRTFNIFEYRLINELYRCHPKTFSEGADLIDGS